MPDFLLKNRKIFLKQLSIFPNHFLTCFMFLLWTTSETLSCACRVRYADIRSMRRVRVPLLLQFYSIVECEMWDAILKKYMKHFLLSVTETGIFSIFFVCVNTETLSRIIFGKSWRFSKSSRDNPSSPPGEKIYPFKTRWLWLRCTSCCLHVAPW